MLQVKNDHFYFMINPEEMYRPSGPHTQDGHSEYLICDPKTSFEVKVSSRTMEEIKAQLDPILHPLFPKRVFENELGPLLLIFTIYKEIFFLKAWIKPVLAKSLKNVLPKKLTGLCEPIFC